MYSVATEELVRLLRGHSDLVTGVQLVPHNHLQLYSSSLDGTVKLWDFTDGILIKTFTIGYKLLALYALPTSEDSVFVIIPKRGERDTFQLVSVKLTKGTGQDTEAKEVSVILEGVDVSPKCTAFGRECEYVASVKGTNLQVYFFKRKQLNRFSLRAKTAKGGNNIFTCVACHPQEDCIATGHADGKIRLWRNFNHRREYTYSTLHWHHDRVMDLAFSAEGITIINSNLRFSKTIQGLIKAREVRTGLVVDPRTKALVLNGEPGHLQFYCLQTDRQLYSLDIVQQEYIHQAGLNQYDLVRVAFSAQGKWLATVEERRETDLELQLKLWLFDEETQSFKLNTRISMPHEGRITAMCFRDTDELEDDSLMLVTAGRDCVFKVWVILEDTDPEVEWSAHLNVVVLQPDPLSEHIAAVSWFLRESSLFVFKPSEPRPICIQRKLCKERVQFAAFVPRDVPETIGSEKYLWLRRSQLFFLTERQELMTVSIKPLEERLTLSSKQLLHTPAHVLPSASFLCPIFINSLLISKENKSAEKVPEEVEMESEEAEDDSDEENNVTEMKQEDTMPIESLGETTYKLSKAEEKELRKIRKVDYSWISVF
ncbi:hypothetical protein ASZ78_009398 [Callipepla squamata]|uniref:WD repeat-containing protein 75 second beta-propeller domain-containing protein n=1 Tax=Callipepla squamata TaxID=9009 RepID=A0A226MZZ0_CALSU|nr:hypothetical protein ASZ78_009398 [Callipepla squamata]